MLVQRTTASTAAANNKIQQRDGARRSDLSLSFFLLQSPSLNSNCRRVVLVSATVLVNEGASECESGRQVCYQ